jgi:hypothetical protein
MSVLTDIIRLSLIDICHITTRVFENKIRTENNEINSHRRFPAPSRVTPRRARANPLRGRPNFRSRAVSPRLELQRAL